MKSKIIRAIEIILLPIALTSFAFGFLWALVKSTFEAGSDTFDDLSA